MDRKTALKILGLPPDADTVQAKTAFRARAKAWHPDRFVGDPDGAKGAEERMKEINAAFHFLSPLLAKPVGDTHDQMSGGAPDPEAQRSKSNQGDDFFSTVRRFFKAHSGKGPWGVKRRYRNVRAASRKRSARPNFESVLNAVDPELCRRASGGDRPVKPRSGPYENYRRHMSVKKRIKAARGRSQDMGPGRVERVCPVRRVDGVGEK